MEKGIVKNLTSVFRRYENKYLSLKKRFITPDKKSDQFIHKYFRVHSRNSIQMLMHPIETMDIAYSKYDMQSDCILMFIKEFTNHNEISSEQIAEFGEAAAAAPGNYTVGTYVVTGTGDYGLKVKPEPGYGDALSMAYDGEELEVLAIVTWEDADDDELLYWGNIEWDGHDAYVCMAYLEKAE